MDRKYLTRRRFLAASGITLGACLLGCAGLGVLVSRDDQPPGSLTIGSPDIRRGDRSLPGRILVAYATAAGSTGGVAELIGRTLADTPSAVDVRPVQAVTQLDEYDAVVLGSAIHGGKWLPEAVEFLQSNRDRLNQVPTAFFLVGLMAAKNSQGDRDLVANYLAEQRELVQPVAEGRFVGALFTQDFPGFTGFGMRFFIAYCGLGFRGGDFRDPAAIRAWAEGVRPLMAA